MLHLAAKRGQNGYKSAPNKRAEHNMDLVSRWELMSLV